MDTDANSVTCTFDSYKMNKTGDRYIWAKEGYITITITPAIPNSTTFAAVRASARYAHATTKGGGADISVNVSGEGYVTFTLSHSKGNSYVQSYGARQKVFYNNGSVVVE